MIRCPTILIGAAKNRNGARRQSDDPAVFGRFSHGTGLASAATVRLELPRAVLIFLSITTCFARVQARAVAMPDLATEVNSCLRLVRVAASRRGRGTLRGHQPVRVRQSRRARS
jgi:hypothetical protein